MFEDFTQKKIDFYKKTILKKKIVLRKIHKKDTLFE